MSFTNPVNEPVLRFSSTDAGAPQINYNVRTAGDVKAVLKACLVTGYGTTASAGWSITNEVNHVAEFVSPSAAMSDYRLGVDDSSASNIAWSYKYQEVLQTIGSVATVNKVPHSDIDKSHAQNGWELLVTNRGFWFVENFYVTKIDGVIANLTYFGLPKSGLASTTSADIIFLSVGVLAFSRYDDDMFKSMTGVFAKIGSFTDVAFGHIALDAIASIVTSAGTPPPQSAYESTVALASQLYFIAQIPSASGDYGREVIGALPGLLVSTRKYTATEFDTRDVVYGDKPALLTHIGRGVVASKPYYYRDVIRADCMLITDYWEY